jgi:hypothetical protein
VAIGADHRELLEAPYGIDAWISCLAARKATPEGLECISKLSDRVEQAAASAARVSPIVFEACDRQNGLLILDGITIGLGRTGQMSAAQTFDLLPDIPCVGMRSLHIYQRRRAMSASAYMAKISAK